MKKYALILLIFIISLFFANSSLADCQKNINIAYSVRSLDQYNTNLVSKYQIPDYREGDLLIITSINIKNNANCTHPASILKISLINPKQEKQSFCDILDIPLIVSNSTYTINISGLTEENPYYPRGWRYKCISKLEDIGDWTVNLDLKPKNDTDSLSGIITYSLFSNNIQYSYRFKVYSKYIFAELDLSRQTLITGSIISILSVILGAFLSYFVGEYTQKRKNNLIRKEAIKSLIYEIKINVGLEKYILDNKNVYLQGGKNEN